MKKQSVSIIVLACLVSACVTDSNYRNREQGGSSVEQRGYGTSYGGTTWHRDETPYYPHPAYDQNRNGIPDNQEIDRNRNGIPDYREVDRNRNGIPYHHEQDRNHNGIPDYKEYFRN